MVYIVLPLFVKRSFLASFMLQRELVLSYNRTVNLSRTAKCSSVMDCGDRLRARNVGVTSSKVFHVSHAVFFPMVPKEDTVSHPV